MARDHGPSFKNDEQYEALRRQGASKEKAARIANSDDESASRGGKQSPYEQWTRDELYARAKELRIEGRSSLDKAALVEALRNH